MEVLGFIKAEVEDFGESYGCLSYEKGEGLGLKNMDFFLVVSLI